MKTLILMRHGEAERGDSDYTRPLSHRGKQQLVQVATDLQDAGVVLDRVLCSSAIRARRSAEIVAEGLGFGGRIEASRRLYDAPAGDYLEALQNTTAGVGTLLFVAHNPGISDLIGWLEGSPTCLEPAGYAIVRRPLKDWKSLARR